MVFLLSARMPCKRAANGVCLGSSQASHERYPSGRFGWRLKQTLPYD
jgi:hypothetical protein